MNGERILNICLLIIIIICIEFSTEWTIPGIFLFIYIYYDLIRFILLLTTQQFKGQKEWYHCKDDSGICYNLLWYFENCPSAINQCVTVAEWMFAICLSVYPSLISLRHHNKWKWRAFIKDDSFVCVYMTDAHQHGSPDLISYIMTDTGALYTLKIMILV